MNPQEKIDRERLARCFIALAERASPSFAEDDVFAYVRECLEALGCRCVLQDYGKGRNLVAILEASETKADAGFPALALAAHADTVEPCAGIRVVRDGDRIASDGTTVLGGDDKAAIAEIIETLRVITENALPHGRIEVVITSAEEVGLIGAKNLDMTLLSAKYCLVLDSSGEPGSAVIAAPHQVAFAIECQGKKAHAGIEPEKGTSAVALAAEVIHNFPIGRLDADSVANYGSIGGGGANNIVPDRATVRGEIRSHSRALLDGHIARLDDACRRAEGRIGGRALLTIIPEHDGLAIAPDHPLLDVVRRAALSCGLAFTTFATGGGSDANILAARGMDCINLACGMRNVHTNEEYVLLSDLEKMCGLLLHMLCGECGILG